MKLISLIALIYLLTELLSRSSEKEIHKKEIEANPGPIELFNSFINMFSKNDDHFRIISQTVLSEDAEHIDLDENQIENIVDQKEESKEINAAAKQDVLDDLEIMLSETKDKEDNYQDQTLINSFTQQDNSIKSEIQSSDNKTNLANNQIKIDSAPVSTLDIKQWTKRNQKKNKK